jgi:methyl-accepting chemotaxis protein
VRPLTVRTKFVIAGAASCAVFTTSAVLAITTFGNMNSLSSQAEAAQHIERSVAQAYEDWTLDDDQSNMYGAVIALGDPSQKSLAETTWQQAVDAYKSTQADMKEVASLATSPAERKLVDKINTDLSDYNTFTVELGKFGHAGQIKQAVRAVSVDNLQPSNDLPTQFSKLLKLEGSASDAAAHRLASAARTGKVLEIVLLIVGALLLAAVMVWLALGIIRPLRELCARMRNIAEGDGDLTARVDEDRTDELGALASAFNTLVDRMQGVIGRFAQSSKALHTSAGELGVVSEQLGAGAEQTSSQATVVAGATEEVNASMSSIAAGARQMSQSIDEIARSASEAARVAAEAVNAAGDAGATVESLSTASSEISQVLDLISGVAAQTSLLALNATIEAARAGEAGKGFAVVADEVKQLAGHTASATDDIAARLAAIEKGTAAVVDSIAAISDATTRINDLASTIAAAVEEQTATTAEFTRAISEAATATNDIADNVSGVATAAEQAATGVRTTRERAESLGSLAGELDELVSAFRC